MCVCQVKALKEKIEEERGKETFPAAGQKLIYAGEPDDSFDKDTENRFHIQVKVLSLEWQ